MISTTSYAWVGGGNTNNSASNPTVANGISSTVTNGRVGVSSLQEQAVSTVGSTNVSFITQQQQIHDSMMADASLAQVAGTVHVSKTSDGHIVLEGSVTTLTQKQKVNDIVEHIAGVGNVNNQLTLK